MNKVLGNLPQGLIFVVSAPAGTGKTTLVGKLTQEFPCVVRSISCTTRQPRPGEENGKDYFFLSEQAFADKLKTMESSLAKATDIYAATLLTYTDDNKAQGDAGAAGAAPGAKAAGDDKVVDAEFEEVDDKKNS